MAIASRRQRAPASKENRRRIAATDELVDALADRREGAWFVELRASSAPAERRKILQTIGNMVEQGVRSEPVSAVFAVKQGKYREFLRILGNLGAQKDSNAIELRRFSVNSLISETGN